MTATKFDHELLRRYGEALPHVTRIPRTVSEIYWSWSGQEPTGRRLSKRERNERRWLARHLFIMSQRGIIHRDEYTEHDYAVVYWWRDLDPADQEADQPGGAESPPLNG